MAQKVIEVVGTSKESFAKAAANAVAEAATTRTVFRHNMLNMVQVDVHGTPGAIGGRWWEIYNNTFTVIPNGNQSFYLHLRGGSGVAFANSLTAGSQANNLGGGGITLEEEDSGSWPLAIR